MPEDKLCYDKLKEDYPPGCHPVRERSFKCCEEDGELDWSFHPDYCKLAGLEDDQRLVPRNYVRMSSFWGKLYASVYVLLI